MAKSSKHSFTYSHKPQLVWDYITKPELIEQWLMKNDFKPVVGHEFNFTTQPMPNYGFNGIVYCKVLEVVPFKKLVYSWKGGPGNGGPYTLDSVVTWTLIETEKGTELHLEHSGFAEDNIHGFSMMDMGWGKGMVKINELANTHKV